MPQPFESVRSATRLLALALGLLLLPPPGVAQDFEHVRSAESDADSLRLATEETPAAAGRVVYRDGVLDRRDGSQADWLDAPRGCALQEGDLLRTGAASHAELELGAGNLLRLAPDSRLDLRRLQDESAEAGAVADLRLEEGDLWAELDGIDSGDTFTIRSGLMGAAITGTALRVAVGPDAETLVRVYRGEVKVGSSDAMLKGGRPTPIERAAGSAKTPTRVSGPVPVAGPHAVSLDEWLVIVKGMQEIRIGSDGRVKAAGAFVAGDSAEAQDWVRWNQERNRRRSGSPPLSKDPEE